MEYPSEREIVIKVLPPILMGPNCKIKNENIKNGSMGVNGNLSLIVW